MQTSRQRQILLAGSLSLTALLIGGLVGAVAVSHTTRVQLQDPEFLRAQLEKLGPEADGPPREAPPALVRVGLAQQKPFQPQRSIIGRLVEVRKVTVASEVTGKIIAMPVEEGTEVVAGKTVLAKIDDVWIKAALDRCKAQVASTQAQLDYESAELRRHESLRGTESTTPGELESKQAAVAGLRAKLDECTAAFEEESERQKRCGILAPFDGTVVAKRAELGAHVAPGSPIVDVVSRGQVDALLMVPESMVNFIREGQQQAVRVDPLGEDVTGKVVSVTPFGPSASRTFPVRVRLDDTHGRLKVGMSVTAMFATAPERTALVVSKDAVLVRPDGSTVWVAVGPGEGQAAEVQPVPVRIGSQRAGEYAVECETAKGRELLVAGARVVVEGAERLMPGQRVRIVVGEARPDAAARRSSGSPEQRPEG